MRALNEEEALAAVVISVRQLFPMFAEHQARALARTVIRSLAGNGVVLALVPPQAPPAEPG